jgi:hypothetical protein
MKNVYCLKNTLTNTYSDPIYRFEDFHTLSKQLHDFIILYPDKAIDQHMNISILLHLGTFDEVTGRFDFIEQIPEYNLKEAWDQLQALKAVTNNA